MKLNKPGAEIYVPDGVPVEEALARTTMLAVSAHQDDIEIMACDGILKGFGNCRDWFTGVVLTDGRGSPRNGLYASYTDDQMQATRKKEQNKAAAIGEYSAQFQLNYSSAEVKDPDNTMVVAELIRIFAAARPKTVYTHNLADKHDTHVAAAIKVIQALRCLPAEARPEKVYGCEVWRDLDWLPDQDKIVFDLSGHDNLAASLMGVFDSQICGGKRYDLAVQGRRRANATFLGTHGTDAAKAVSFAMDLTPLIRDPQMDIREFVLEHIKRFAEDVKGKIQKYLPGPE